MSNDRLTLTQIALLTAYTVGMSGGQILFKLAAVQLNGIAGERMLAYQVAPRIAWYRSLWARREELTNALYSRLANLPQPGRQEPLRRPAEYGALS